MQALFTTPDADTRARWLEIPEPVIETTDDAIVRPLAVAACDLDRVILSERSPFPGSFALGHEFVGRVTAVGEKVTRLAVGDAVLASFQPSCGTCDPCGRAITSVCGSVPNGTMYGIGATGGDWGGALADAIRVPWADFNLLKLEDGDNLRAVASASDNLADGLRTVLEPLSRRPNARVLVAGSGSIALYAVLCATHLGASDVTVASPDKFVLQTAEALGALCLHVHDWPKRFADHDITVDCTNTVAGLDAVLRSTAPYGECTSASIYFQGAIPVPMFHLNMRGISFHTGRVNSAGAMRSVMQQVRNGLDPEKINPAYVEWGDAVAELATQPRSRKVIVHRPE